jgi:hypothetical protein
MSPIPTALVTAVTEAAPRGQTLLRRAQASPWVSFLESGRVVLGVMVKDVMEHQLGVLVGPCWPEASFVVLDDVARAHRQQTELAVNRLAKDAEAGFSEW